VHGTNRESVCPTGQHRPGRTAALCEEARTNDPRQADRRDSDYAAFVRGTGCYDPDSPGPGKGSGRHPS